MTDYYMGLEIVQSPLCKRRVPVREHKRPQHPRQFSYHNRVQKKWVKRYGMRDQYDVYLTSRQAFMHPDTFKEMCAACFYGKPVTGALIDDCHHQ